MNIFKTKEKSNTLTKEVTIQKLTAEDLLPKKITSQVISDDMDKELNFLLNDNNINIIETQVKSIISDNGHIIKKAEKLVSLGFTGTPSAVLRKDIAKSVEERQASISLNKEEIKLRAKYLLKYPSYKFVPERIFKSVCEKYDLYTSNPGRYNKEIPDKNLGEIMGFVPLIEPVWVVRTEYLGFSRSMATDEIFSDKKLAQKYYDDKFSSHGRDSFGHISYSCFEKQKFAVTAPISHFNVERSEIKDRIISDVTDPIVSHEVEGGRIIVSVWDKEADIPEIKNENLN